MRPGPVPQITPRKGRTIGEVVSLRLEMAAYFRRSTLPAVPDARIDLIEQPGRGVVRVVRHRAFRSS